ncbi:hypothetical protein MATR_04160 [Marivirga tractuosa]|nr:hypothetical protein MATR_04160 [Marivirga tractuosa]
MIKNFFNLFYIKLYSTLKQKIPSALGVEGSASAFISSLLFFFNFIVIYYVVFFLMFNFNLSSINWLPLLTYFIVPVSYFTIIIFGFFYFKEHHQKLYSQYKNQKISISFPPVLYIIYCLATLGVFMLSTYYFFSSLK